MTLDDLKKLMTGRTLFRLDTIIAPRLVPLLYAFGLAAILLWAISHLFLTFGSNFGNGLWGLLEIVVFGVLAWIVLRILCDGLVVYFRAHEDSTDEFARTRLPSSLLDEVREAIHDLAEEEEPDYTEADEYITPATDPVPSVETPPAPPPQPEPKVKTPRRTARRSPPKSEDEP
jgi:hypothetical protein